MFLLIPAIRSLDSLNDQIVEFVLTDSHADVGHAPEIQRGALVPAVTLMRQLLIDAQVCPYSEVSQIVNTDTRTSDPQRRMITSLEMFIHTGF